MLSLGNDHAKNADMEKCSFYKTIKAELRLEMGRRDKTSREEKLCQICNCREVENETHFMLTCPVLRDLRNKLLPETILRSRNLKALLETGSVSTLINVAV